MPDHLQRHWFLVGLFAVIFAGLMWPEGGAQIRKHNWVTPLLIALIMFIVGFNLQVSNLKRQVSNLRAVGAVIATVYLVAPLLAFGLAKLLAPAKDVNHEFLVGMMLMSAQAGSLASAVAMTMLAKAETELALILTLVTNLLTAFFTPLVLDLTIGTNVKFPVSEMMSRMILVMLLPVAIGQFVRWKFWTSDKAPPATFRIAPQMIILVFVYTGFSAAADKLLSGWELILRFSVACALLHLALLFFAKKLGEQLKLDEGSTVALIFCGSQKTLPNGIYLWDKYFSAQPFAAVPLVLYHLFQLVVDTVIATRIGGRAKKPLDSEASAG